MGLSNKKEEQLRKMPIIEARVFKSKNGKVMVHKTTITSFKPVAYYEAILSAPGEEDVPDEIQKVIEEVNE